MPNQDPQRTSRRVIVKKISELNKLLYLLATAVLIFCSFRTAEAQAREVRYYNEHETEVDKSEAFYIGVVQTSTDIELVTFYTMDSILVSRKEYGNVDVVSGKRPLHGRSTQWYQNGKKKSRTEYVNGLIHGDKYDWYASGAIKYKMTYRVGLLHDTLYGYYESGNLRRMDLYRLGTLVKGKLFSDDGKVLPHVPHAGEPHFPGGRDKMIAYLRGNLRYPDAAYESRARGSVLVQFTVNIDGSLEDLTVIESAHPALDREAIRVIKRMPPWVPASREGNPEKGTAFLFVRF